MPKSIRRRGAQYRQLVETTAAYNTLPKCFAKYVSGDSRITKANFGASRLDQLRRPAGAQWHWPPVLEYRPTNTDA